MSTFISKAILDFFIAFGIVLGGAMLGGMGAVVSLQPPTQTMLEVAGRIKIWALAAAVGERWTRSGSLKAICWMVICHLPLSRYCI